MVMQQLPFIACYISLPIRINDLTLENISRVKTGGIVEGQQIGHTRLLLKLWEWGRQKSLIQLIYSSTMGLFSTKALCNLQKEVSTGSIVLSILKILTP